MGEGQSRYGIMEELNNRKIKEKEKLANIEREADNKTYEMEKAITKAEDIIADKEKCYKQEHKDRVREREVNLTLLEQDYSRKKKQLQEEVKDDKENYEVRFQEWKKEQMGEVTSATEEFDRYEEEQKKKIDTKKEVITEIENGIASLKEISSDQKVEK